MTTFPIRWLVAVLALLACAGAVAEESGDWNTLFPPDQVLQQRQALGLSEAQVRAIEAAVKEAMGRMPDLQAALQRETDAMRALTQAPHVDPAAARLQMDRVLEAERPMKHLQLGLMIAVRNALTPAQQARLRQLPRSDPLAGHPELAAKMQKVQARVQDWQRRGRDLSPVASRVQRFEQQMSAGRIAEASATVDDILAFFAAQDAAP
jgi:Spy/CpxP family protein refolding chaperone